MNIVHTLEELKQQDLYRQLAGYEPLDATHGLVEGQTCLLLASNNYLGLTHHSAVIDSVMNACRKYGAGSGGSRLTTGNHFLYSILEDRLASFKETEAALVFNTGYMANTGIISALAGPNDVIFSDEFNHASIIDGCRLSKARTVVYRHNDMAHLAQCLAAAPCSGQRLIVTDGVFSMDGDIAPLDHIVRLAEKYGAFVMVDDAHATGCIGPGGRGTAAYYNVSDKVHISMGTLSKALGAEGGFAAGKRVVIDYLINKGRSFIFSTALAPATVAAADAALQQLMHNPQLVDLVNTNAAYLRGELAAAGFATGDSKTPIIPVIIGSAAKTVQFAACLREQGLIISAIRPPTVPQGTSRLRITVSAAHSADDLARAALKIITAGRALQIIP